MNGLQCDSAVVNETGVNGIQRQNHFFTFVSNGINILTTLA